MGVEFFEFVAIRVALYTITLLFARVACDTVALSILTLKSYKIRSNFVVIGRIAKMT